MAWLAAVGPRGVDATIGRSVRSNEGGLFEGTWVGRPELMSLPLSSMVFGSGVIDDGEGLVIVPPSHPFERVYHVRAGEGSMLSNSLVWLLEAAGIELLQQSIYPKIFVKVATGARSGLVNIPTSGAHVTAMSHHNFRLSEDQPIVEPRPRERPFASFEDFRSRLVDALEIAARNARNHELVATISTGYNSTAAACLAAQVGCRRAVSLKTATPMAGTSTYDSGAATARTLGMELQDFDRLAYLGRTDLPEAEFLATGMTGDDVVFAEMETAIADSMLISGLEAVRLKPRPWRRSLYRADLYGYSMTEFRLRIGFIHVPILMFGATEQASLKKIAASKEMRPFSVRGRYNKPLQRRIAEEAAIPRGSFATEKKRPNATLHSEGMSAMAPQTVVAIEAFAAANGVTADDRPEGITGLLERSVMKVGKRLSLPMLTGGFAGRRRRRVHFQSGFGSLLFRWSVSVVRQRYASNVVEALTSPVLSVGTGSSERVAASITERP